MLKREIVTENGETYPKWSGGNYVWDKAFVETAEAAWQLGYNQMGADIHAYLDREQEKIRALLDL